MHDSMEKVGGQQSPSHEDIGGAEDRAVLTGVMCVTILSAEY